MTTPQNPVNVGPVVLAAFLCVGRPPHARRRIGPLVVRDFDAAIDRIELPPPTESGHAPTLSIAMATFVLWVCRGGGDAERFEALLVFRGPDAEILEAWPPRTVVFPPNEMSVLVEFEGDLRITRHGVHVFDVIADGKRLTFCPLDVELSGVAGRPN